jgi:hypothetical protein
MSWRLERVCTIGQEAAVELIRRNQPSIDFSHNLVDEVVKIAKYATSTFDCIDYLASKRYCCEGCSEHLLKGIVGVIVIAVITVLFFSAVGMLLTASTSEHVLRGMIMLFVSYHGGCFGIELVRNADAAIRYEACRVGLRSCFT